MDRLKYTLSKNRGGYRTDTVNVIGVLEKGGSYSQEIARRIYDASYICPCLNAHASDTIPKIIERTI